MLQWGCLSLLPVLPPSLPSGFKNAGPFGGGVAGDDSQGIHGQRKTVPQRDLPRLAQWLKPIILRREAS